MMRTREEIQKTLNDLSSKTMGNATTYELDALLRQEVTVELLLDIRELLKQQDATLERQAVQSEHQVELLMRLAGTG